MPGAVFMIRDRFSFSLQIVMRNCNSGVPDILASRRSEANAGGFLLSGYRLMPTVSEAPWALQCRDLAGLLAEGLAGMPREGKGI
jgi:hypothetical protein